MIYIASDHAAYELKNHIAEYLKESWIEYEDIGPHEYDEFDDYPDFIIPCAEKVAVNPEENLGIVMWGSGQWEAIAANKVSWIRCALYYWGSKDILSLSKTHNNANMLSLWGRFLERDKAIEAVKLWLDTKFQPEERHERRINKIHKYESK